MSLASQLKPEVPKLRTGGHFLHPQKRCPHIAKTQIAKKRFYPLMLPAIKALRIYIAKKGLASLGKSQEDKFFTFPASEKCLYDYILPTFGFGCYCSLYPTNLQNSTKLCLREYKSKQGVCFSLYFTNFIKTLFVFLLCHKLGSNSSQFVGHGCRNRLY